MKLLLFFIVIIFILFFPFKVKLYFSYIDSSFQLKLYNFSIFPSKKKKHLNRKKKKSSKKKKKKPLNNLTPNNILLFISNFNKRKFKPKFFLDFNFTYSLNDAKNTALSFGAIHSVIPFILRFFSIFFKISPPKLSINPSFKDLFFITLKGQCIITLSLGQIIYTAFILIKEFYKLRRCPK
ncbi:MAG: DUF2953 domain-containing protein [Clostridium sp.]|uniref:DUF2953 domain-containing protein n=1 Tax=Clostridium sp. TaxID=1506 RepID=UPI003EE480AD